MTAPPMPTAPPPTPADLAPGDTLMLSWDDLAAWVRTLDPETTIEVTRWPVDFTLRLSPPPPPEVREEPQLTWPARRHRIRGQG